jgi:CheY-specific phosphatase CheX
MQRDARLRETGEGMDVTLINPFLFGAREVLQKMAFMETTIGAPYVKKMIALPGT